MTFFTGHPPLRGQCPPGLSQPLSFCASRPSRNPSRLPGSEAWLVGLVGDSAQVNSETRGRCGFSLFLTYMYPFSASRSKSSFCSPPHFHPKPSCNLIYFFLPFPCRGHASSSSTRVNSIASLLHRELPVLRVRFVCVIVSLLTWSSAFVFSAVLWLSRSLLVSCIPLGPKSAEINLVLHLTCLAPFSGKWLDREVLCLSQSTDCFVRDIAIWEFGGGRRGDSSSASDICQLGFVLHTYSWSR